VNAVFLDSVGMIAVWDAADQWHAVAQAAFDRGEAGEAGIVDNLSFQVMRRLGLTEALTNDQHFHAAGFTTLF
jgi:predicted nucleic acid-binding protein